MPASKWNPAAQSPRPPPGSARAPSAAAGGFRSDQCVPKQQFKRRIPPERGRRTDRLIRSSSLPPASPQLEPRKFRRSTRAIRSPGFPAGNGVVSVPAGIGRPHRGATNGRSGRDRTERGVRTGRETPADGPTDCRPTCPPRKIRRPPLPFRTARLSLDSQCRVRPTPADAAIPAGP